METVTVLVSPIVREEGRKGGMEGVLFDPPGEQSPEQLKSLRKLGPGNLDRN